MATTVFYRIKWSTNPIEAKLWYGNPIKQDIQKEKVRIGSEFHIKIGQERYCIGSESGKGEWITCKTRRLRDGEKEVNSSLKFKFTDDATTLDKSNKDTLILMEDKNYIQCYRCSTAEYFTCRMTCMGDFCNPTSEKAKALCQPARTSVYLTHVGGEMKVGVSLGIPRRWVEQGSDLATVLATAPGLEARRLEQAIANRLDLKLQVRNTSKIKELTSVNLDKAELELRSIIKDSNEIIHDVLEGVPGYTARVPEIVDLSQHYGNLNFNTPVQLVEALPGNEFGGTIVGIKGSILIVNQGSYHYALDLKKLRSREFEFLDRNAKIATQSYLDQWF